MISMRLYGNDAYFRVQYKGMRRRAGRRHKKRGDAKASPLWQSNDCADAYLADSPEAAPCILISTFSVKPS